MTGPLTDDMRTAAYRAARQWATDHDHPQPDDRMIGSALTAALAATATQPGQCAAPGPDGLRCERAPGHLSLIPGDDNDHAGYADESGELVRW